MTTGRYTVPTCMNLPGLFSSSAEENLLFGSMKSARMTVYLNYLATSQISWCHRGLGAKEEGEFNGAKMILKLGSSLVPFLKVGWSSRNIRSFDPGTYDFTGLYFIHLIDAVLPFFWPSTPLRWKSPDSKSHAHVASWWWTLLESHGPGPLVKQTNFPWRPIGSDSIGLIRIGMAILVGSVTGGTSTLDV